jgi:hypothetical protein
MIQKQWTVNQNKIMKKFLTILFIFCCLHIFSQTTTTLTTAGSGVGSWTVPCGVTSVTVQCWGGGGGGGGDGTAGSPGGSGGGGGGFVTNVLTVTGNQVISYTVGAGGTGGAGNASGTVGGNTIFSSITANGGSGGLFNNASTTAGGSGSGGTIATGTIGAAGGASGGNGGTGGGVGGGAGGVGGAANANGTAGTAPGGGGGGGGSRTGGANNGAAGGIGKVTIIFTNSFGGFAGIDQTLLACNYTANLSASLPAGYTGGTWSCLSNCGTAVFANSTSSTTSVSGLLSASTTTLQWSATHPSGCIATDEIVITLPACPLTNNNCSNATSLTVNAGLICNQNTTGFNTEVGECVVVDQFPSSNNTAWYRFTATDDSLILNFLSTLSPRLINPYYAVFGPFASGAGCMPACASAITSGQMVGDPGMHILLTGLATTGNRDYLIEIQGYGSANFPYCINLSDPASNSFAPASAAIINNCGITYNGTTNGGYFQSGTGLGFANLDGSTTTCTLAGCSADEDVSFVVNNISWFKFCSVNTGTYNIQFDVGACVFSGANSGSQMAVLTGTNTNLTNIWQAANPTQPASPLQTSPNFSLAAGGCAYLVVDGFAGDACSYSYVLTNVAGGCVLLPIELLSFNAIQKVNIVELTWATATELNNDFYTIERSDDGINFKDIEKIDGAGISSNVLFYSTKDINPLNGLSYYRLKQTDFSGRNTYSKIVSVEYKNTNDLEFEIVPNPSIDNVISNIVLNTIPNGLITIEITNTQGEILYEVTKKHDSNKIEIPNHFAKGIYFVKVIHSDFIQTKRMMIK